MCGTVLTNHDARNAAAAVQQWKKFGIDAEVLSIADNDGLQATGDFDVSGNWPAQEPWGAGPDLYRVLDRWNSAYKKPLGERTQGIYSRWSSDEMDAIIKKLRETDPFDTEAVIAVGHRGPQGSGQEHARHPDLRIYRLCRLGRVLLDQLAWQRKRL